MGSDAPLSLGDLCRPPRGPPPGGPSGGPLLPSGGLLLPSGGLLLPSRGPLLPAGGPLLPSGGLLLPSGVPKLPPGGPPEKEPIPDQSAAPGLHVLPAAASIGLPAAAGAAETYTWLICER